MVEGRLRKYYEEVVLLEQVCVIDGESRVARWSSVAKEAGAPITVTGFVRFVAGRGHREGAAGLRRRGRRSSRR